MNRYTKYLLFIIFASMALIMNEAITNPPTNITIQPTHYNHYQALGYNQTDLKILEAILTENQMNDIIRSEISKEVLFSYLKIKTFDFQNIHDYETIRTKKQISYKAAINLTHHPHITKDFYQYIQEAINLDNLLTLVNKNYALKKDYIPNHLVFTEEVNLLIDDNSRYYLQEEAYQAYKALFKEAKKHGYILYLSNGYRSYQKQEMIYNRYTLEIGNADLFSARPGHSEHQTGLAVDITCRAIEFLLIEDFSNTEEGQFIKHNAHRFGFIERYPKDKEDITGYRYEPWHLRYVGVDVATIIYENNLTLEEYLIYYTVMPK